jgi:hypothetical protein
MPTPEREFKLSNGSVWTARQVGEYLNITPEGARYRLRQTNDVDFIFQKKNTKSAKPVRRNKATKLFTVSDGSCLNARQLSMKYNIHQSTMYARLSKGIRDVKLLARKPEGGGSGYDSFKEQPKKLQKSMQDRMMYNKEFDWRLFLKTV